MTALAPDFALALATVTDNLSKVCDYLLDNADYDYDGGHYRGNPAADFAHETEYVISMLNRLNHNDKLDPIHEVRCMLGDLIDVALYFNQERERLLQITLKPNGDWAIEPYKKASDAAKYLAAAVAQLERLVEGK